MYRDYFATENQKQILEKLLKQNEQKEEEKKREKYNPDDIFKKDKEDSKIENNNEILPIEIEEKWYQKILDFFRGLFVKQ